MIALSCGPCLHTMIADHLDPLLALTGGRTASSGSILDLDSPVDGIVHLNYLWLQADDKLVRDGVRAVS